MIELNLSKLQENKDVSLHEMNPSGAYVLVVNKNNVNIQDILHNMARLMPQVKTIMFVDGTPYESISMYEIL